MANPVVGDWEAAFVPQRNFRLAQTFARQQQPRLLTVYTDADFAGDEGIGHSGFANTLGSHNLSVACKTQSVIALSSGESELYALDWAAQRGLGF